MDIDARSAELPRAPQEEGFKARVEESRQAELKELFKFTMLKSMFGVVWEGMGYVTMMVAFSAYSYTGQALTADVAFPALALFDILRMPMIMMPNIIGSMVQISMVHCHLRRGRYWVSHAQHLWAQAAGCSRGRAASGQGSSR